jgi:hypothetical protein
MPYLAVASASFSASGSHPGERTPCGLTHLLKETLNPTRREHHRGPGGLTPHVLVGSQQLLGTVTGHWSSR